MKRILILLLIAIFSFTTACDKSDEDDPKDMNKIIPSVKTMQVDLPSSRSSIDGGVCGLGALVFYGVGTAISITPVAIPVTIFSVLKNQIPTTAKKDYVQWAYTGTASGQTYTVAVTAEKKGGEYDWEWSVAINDYVWITGASMADKTSGWWQFHAYNYPVGANNVVKVEWNYTDDENRSLKVLNNESDENIIPGGENGDYINFTQAGNDYTMVIYDKTNKDGVSVKATVTVNSTTNKGSLTIDEGYVGIYSTTNTPCTW